MAMKPGKPKADIAPVVRILPPGTEGYDLKDPRKSKAQKKRRRFCHFTGGRGFATPKP